MKVLILFQVHKRWWKWSFYATFNPYYQKPKWKVVVSQGRGSNSEQAGKWIKSPRCICQAVGLLMHQHAHGISIQVFPQMLLQLSGSFPGSPPVVEVKEKRYALAYIFIRFSCTAYTDWTQRGSWHILYAGNIVWIQAVKPFVCIVG